MKQNGVVCWPGPALLFFIFRSEYLISGPEKLPGLSRNGPVAPVAQKVDNPIHRINLNPLDSAIGFPNTHLLDSDLSG